MNYETHLVAFLDILGFSNICISSEASDGDREKLSEIFRYCNQIKESFSTITGKESIHSTIVSDSIVLTLKTEKEKPTINEIRNFVLAAGQFQYFLGENGFWLRGGISCGPLYVNLDEKQIVGPALIRAVNLEKNVAKYPRIVADTTLMLKAGIQNVVEFRKEVNKSSDDSRLRPFYEASTMIDSVGIPQISNDVPFIVDFMSSARPASPLKIAKFVAAGLRGSITHYEKYRWLADYILASHRQNFFGADPESHQLNILLG
jgi:hypothetical protein